jgi:thioredoxin 1
MSSTVKVLVVVALIVAVGAVMAVKRGRDTTPATPTGAAVTALEAPQASNLPRLVDLGSTTCIPCKMMAPVLEELQKEYAGRLDVSFIDVRKIPDAASHFKIQVIPTQIFYDPNGQEQYRHEGFLSKQDILAKWKELGVTLETQAPVAQPPRSDETR